MRVSVPALRPMVIGLEGIMTHEKRAKKILEQLFFYTTGYTGNEERKQIDQFFHHLKEAVKAEIRTNGIHSR